MGYFIVFVNLLVKEKNLKTFVLRLNLMVMAQFDDKVRFLIGMVSTTAKVADMSYMFYSFQFLIGMVSTQKKRGK